HVEGYAGETDRTYPLKDDPFPREDGQLSPVIAYRRKMRRWLDNGIDEKEQERKAYYGSAPSVHKGHFEEIEALAQALLRDRPAPCDEIDGARATACCMAAVRSMQEGYKTIDIRPDDYQLHKKRR